jgi:hypothetical protein
MRHPLCGIRYAAKRMIFLEGVRVLCLLGLK